MAAAGRVGISAFDRIEALVANPELYALADAVPEPDPARGGRPRHYPVFMWLLYDALLSVFGSARQVEAELAHPVVWNELRRHVRARFPSDPQRWLPAEPMRRHHYLYGRSRYLTDPTTLDRLLDLHRHHATAQSKASGLCDPDGPGSWTHPDLSRVLYADGKVQTPLFRTQPGDRRRHRRTGHFYTPRLEPDAALHFEGTGEAAWGTKFVLVAARHPEPNRRFILDIAWVPTPGAEAATAIESFTRLAPHLPGAQAVVYDTALRGVHHQHLLRTLGLLPVNRVTAASASRAPRRKGSRRTEKLTYLETRTITHPDGTSRDVTLLARGGQVGIGELTDTGTTTFQPLPRVRTHRNADKNGRYRWYNDYRLPTHYGGGTITVRLHGNDTDTQRRFNRTENVRPIPPGDPDFDRLYRRRNDAESINRHLDDTLWLRRAHSIGHRRQLLNLLTYALGINAIATRLADKQEPPSQPAHAA